ncbi:MAG: DNRLRE domain-containing protein [Candidatus Thermoplasmatota archaeon]
MSPPHHGHFTDELALPGARAPAALCACALMLLSSLLLIGQGASSDPTVIDNPDDTTSIVWDFDQGSDYTLSGTVLQGGDATLSWLNESDGDYDSADYSAGTETNVDTSSFAGKVVVDDRVSSHFFSTQPGTEGVDSYLSENRVNDNFGASSNLLMDSEDDKRMHIVLWFDLAAIPTEAVVDDATLWLYQTQGSRGVDVEFDVHRLTVSFVESEVCWAKSTVSTTWTNPGGDYDPYSYGRQTAANVVGWMGIDVSKLAEGWARSPTDNIGLVLVPVPAAGDNQKAFQSSDDTDAPEQNPRLVVNYTVQGGTGVLESRHLGPGTNATFTTASYSATGVSLLDDAFGGTTLLPKWTWLNDPALSGGSCDVGVTRPGWVHILGSPNSPIDDTAVSCNFLHQEVTGDFSASTLVDEAFTTGSMGAGLLIYEGPREWLYLSKVGTGASGTVQAAVCHNGTSSTVATSAWADLETAHLRAVRNSTGVWLHASQDGTDFGLVHHDPASDALMQRVDVGLFLFSLTISRPAADFDHFTVSALVPPSVEVRGRVGNSTSPTDPTWEEWELADVLPSPCPVGEQGRYVQYRVYMSTDLEWYTPAFSAFTCWYERYSPSGTVETEDYLASDFSMWYTLTTDETDDRGLVRYSYSLDNGDTWTLAGSGGSYSIASAEPQLRVRASLQTFDTLSTPRVHSVSAMHGTAVSYLVVVVPETAVAGETFPVTVYVKDGSNTTMVHWTGPVELTAVDSGSPDDIDTELAVTSAYITTGGSVTVPNEACTEAETIIIVAEAQGAYGLSTPITVTPAPASELTITPAPSFVPEDSEQTFTALATDDFDNPVTDLEFLWEVDPELGSLNRHNGSSVRLYVGEAGSDGYLRVSAGGLQASLHLTVTHTANAPTFVQSVPDQLKYEDSGSWTIDLSPYVQDSVHLDSELRWYVTNDAVVQVSGENRTGYLTLTLSTKQDLSGTDVLGLHVVDPDGLSASTNLTVHVIAVNDWPTVDAVEPLEVRYGVLYVYNMRYYVHDVDDDEGDLSLSVDDASSAHVSAEGLALHMLYPQELNGTDQAVVVTVSDGSATASTVVQVTVSDNNVPVAIDAVPDVDMYQGETRVDVFDLDDYFVDPDGDELFFTYGYTHVLINISAGNIVSIFAPMDWYGSDYIIFSATDASGARVESVGTIVVHRVNQAPVIEGVPDLRVMHDLGFEFDLTWYVSDPDNDLDDLHVATDDAHAVPAGMVLTLLYPAEMVGQVVYLGITVSDGELSDSWAIEVSVGDNTPPSSAALPMHSFQEDVPMPYPSSGDLRSYFDDADGEDLTFTVFAVEDAVSAAASEDAQGAWTVVFSTEANWNGNLWFVVRATDPGGALVESMAELTVQSVPDAPSLDFEEGVEATVGVQVAVDLRESAVDPDRHEQGLTFTLSGDHGAYATVLEGVLLLHFPGDFLADGEQSRTVSIAVTASDPDGLRDTDTLTVTVVRAEGGGEDAWFMVGMLAMAGVAAGSFAVAIRFRKEPFVVRDIMLIHNDGFLIGRAAEKVKGEVDEDVLSGMLTAVLNFVEDSMAKTQDGLRSFGFEHYKVLVRRGRTTYMAVVYEGDAPEAIEDRMAGFLAKVEKIYRKRIENWTGDIDTDFAGVGMLLQSFVRENSRRGRGLNGPARKDGGDAALPE